MSKRIYTIRRIGLLSSFKVGCLVGAGFIAVSGICFVPFLFMSSFTMLSSLNSEFGSDLPVAELGGGVVGFVVFFLVLVVVYGVWTGLTAWFYALLYNLIARLAGGLQVELEREKGSTAKNGGPPPWLE